MSTKVLFHYDKNNYHNQCDWLMHGYCVVKFMDYGKTNALCRFCAEIF